MKFSIIIPCYKQAEYLPEAIESALGQTYKDIEIIVVNDGSPDATREVAERYPVKIINQTNKGLSSARNTAIMNATGDYILPLDADDILLPNCVERMAQVAAETDAAVIAPSIRCFGVANQDVILMQNPSLDDFKEGNRLVYCSAIKRGVLLECGGYSSRMVEGWEDLHLWYDLMNRGKKIYTLQEVLVQYRTKITSMWTEARDKYGDKLWAQINKDFPETIPHKKV